MSRQREQIEARLEAAGLGAGYDGAGGLQSRLRELEDRLMVKVCARASSHYFASGTDPPWRVAVVCVYRFTPQLERRLS